MEKFPSFTESFFSIKQLFFVHFPYGLLRRVYAMYEFHSVPTISSFKLLKGVLRVLM